MVRNEKRQQAHGGMRLHKPQVVAFWLEERDVISCIESSHAYPTTLGKQTQGQVMRWQWGSVYRVFIASRVKIVNHCPIVVTIIKVRDSIKDGL